MFRFSKILIDTGDSNVREYTDSLRRALSSELNGASIGAVICTHWHPDHVGGLSDVLTDVVGSSIPAFKLKRPDLASDQWADKFTFVEDGHVFETQGATLRCLARIMVSL